MYSKGKIADTEMQITRVSQENERKQSALKSENKEVKRIYDEYKALKTEMNIFSTIPDGITVIDIDDTSDIIKYTRAITDHNMKLRTATQRTSIIMPQVNMMQQQQN